MAGIKETFTFKSAILSHIYANTAVSNLREVPGIIMLEYEVHVVFAWNLGPLLQLILAGTLTNKY
jgi:hypothetical protein